MIHLHDWIEDWMNMSNEDQQHASEMLAIDLLELMQGHDTLNGQSCAVRVALNNLHTAEGVTG